AVAKLFRPGAPLTLPNAVATAKGAVRDGRAACHFPDLAEGAYALVVFHDTNDNGAIDHRFGWPAEPLGFSGGFRLSLTSGRPTFEKLRFDVVGATVLDVEVR
ncbi:MAG: DUF2141 domain-containing protein, partial [Myxococcota bacterium]